MNFLMGKTKFQPVLIGILLGGNGGPPRGGSGRLEVGNDSLGSGGSPLGKASSSTTRSG
jgi:hypothetical protein